MMHKPKRKVFTIRDHSWNTWDDIFSTPQDIEAEIMVTGSLNIHNRYFLNLGHPNARNIKSTKLTVPVLCLIIYHRATGVYRIDCGLDSSYQTNTHGDMRGPLRKLFWPLKSYPPPGQDIGSQLDRRGIQPQGLFLTHLHADHCSGVRHLPRGIPIVIGRSEPFYSCGPLFYQDSFREVDTLYEIDFRQAKPLPPLGPCADLLGDSALWAIHTPGHRQGHVSFLINGKKKAALYTGDACDIRQGFEQVVGPGFGSYDKALAQSSLEQLVAFKQRYNHLNLVFGHQLPLPSQAQEGVSSDVKMNFKRYIISTRKHEKA